MCLRCGGRLGGGKGLGRGEVIVEVGWEGGYEAEQTPGAVVIFDPYVIWFQSIFLT